MKQRMMAGLAAGIAVALMSAAGAAGEKKKCPQSPISELQNRWALAVTWQPAFCETFDTEKREFPKECHLASNKETFTLHGLWPQWEEYCVAALPPEVLARNQRYITNTCEMDKKWEELPEITLSADLKKRQAEVMPGIASYLDRHEYYKHGTCSLLNYEDYFNLAISLTEKLNQTSLPAFILNSAGDKVTKRQLCKAVETALGPQARMAVEAQHVERPDDNGQNRFYLTELFIWLQPVNGKLDLATENYVEVKSGTKTLGQKPADALCDDNLDKHVYYIDRPGMGR